MDERHCEIDAVGDRVVDVKDNVAYKFKELECMKAIEILSSEINNMQKEIEELKKFLKNKQVI